MKKIRNILALLLAAMLLMGLLSGCTAEEIGAAIDAASEIVEILEESGDTPEASPAPAKEEPAKPSPTPEAAPEPTPEPTAQPQNTPEPTAQPDPEPAIDEDGQYTTKDDVALYIHTYGHLPSNFVTKKEAQKKGWPGGDLEPYCPGMSIGGDYFGNREGLLPSAKGRTWTECDINTMGKHSRGAERIVFSNDGLIYYTGDHYESYELLYGTP